MTAPVALALETTGLRPEAGHRIVQIALASAGKLLGAHSYLPRSAQCEEWWWHPIDPEREVDPAATAIHGETRETLRGHPKFADIADPLLAAIDGQPLIGWNLDFDIEFVDAELHRLDRGPLRSHCSEAIDLLTVARDRRPGERHTLERLAVQLGCQVPKRSIPWKAVRDAVLTSRCWQRMQEEIPA